jgi:phenylacetate-CoA ligase
MPAIQFRESLYFGIHRVLVGSSLGKTYHQLIREEKTPDSLTLTRQKLVGLLAHAQKSVPYYSDLFAQIGGGFEENPEQFLTQLPVLTKDVIRENYEQIKSKDLARRKWVYNSSGGSTGEPIRLIQDRQFTDHQMAIQWLSYYWAGRKPGERSIHLWGSRMDLSRQEELKRKSLNRLTNDWYFNAFMMPVEKMRAYIDALNRRPPKLVVAYAQSIYELVQFAENEGIKVMPQKAILTSAGTLHPFMRKKIESAFKCKIFDRYGSREVGDIACECEVHQGLHVFPQGNFLEIVDDQGRRVPNGMEGNILVTNLYNYAMPLIRYSIGDRGVLSSNGTCSCGRRGQILERLSGRNVEMFRRKDGTLVEGVYFNHLLYYRVWVKKYQVVQKDYSNVVFKVQKTRKDYQPDESELEEIRSQTKLVMGSDCLVTIEFLDDIPPSRSGKYSYTVCEIGK